MQCDCSWCVGVVGAAPSADVGFEHAAHGGDEFFVLWCGSGVVDGWACVGDFDGAHCGVSLVGMPIKKAGCRRC